MLDMNAGTNLTRSFVDTANINPAEAALELIKETMIRRNRNRNQDGCVYPIKDLFAKVVDDIKSKSGSDINDPSAAAAIDLAKQTLDI